MKKAVTTGTRRTRSTIITRRPLGEATRGVDGLLGGGEEISEEEHTPTGVGQEGETTGVAGVEDQASIPSTGTEGVASITEETASSVEIKTVEEIGEEVEVGEGGGEVEVGAHLSKMGAESGWVAEEMVEEVEGVLVDLMTDERMEGLNLHSIWRKKEDSEMERPHGEVDEGNGALEEGEVEKTTMKREEEGVGDSREAVEMISERTEPRTSRTDEAGDNSAVSPTNTEPKTVTARVSVSVEAEVEEITEMEDIEAGGIEEFLGSKGRVSGGTERMRSGDGVDEVEAEGAVPLSQCMGKTSGVSEAISSGLTWCTALSPATCEARQRWFSSGLTCTDCA